MRFFRAFQGWELLYVAHQHQHTFQLSGLNPNPCVLQRLPQCIPRDNPEGQARGRVGARTPLLLFAGCICGCHSRTPHTTTYAQRTSDSSHALAARATLPRTARARGKRVCIVPSCRIDVPLRERCFASCTPPSPYTQNARSAGVHTMVHKATWRIQAIDSDATSNISFRASPSSIYPKIQRWIFFWAT